MCGHVNPCDSTTLAIANFVSAARDSMGIRLKYLVTNRVYWEISRILNLYRKCWTGTETFHRDGKQHRGMGDDQLHTAKGQTRHLYLVMLAHTVSSSPNGAGPCVWLGS